MRRPCGNTGILFFAKYFQHDHFISAKILAQSNEVGPDSLDLRSARRPGLHLNQRAVGKNSGGLVSFVGVAVTGSSDTLSLTNTHAHGQSHLAKKDEKQHGLFEKWNIYWILV